jgi:hypothetical protein
MMKVQGSWKIVILAIVTLLAMSVLVAVIEHSGALVVQTGDATYYGVFTAKLSYGAKLLSLNTESGSSY